MAERKKGITLHIEENRVVIDGLGGGNGNGVKPDKKPVREQQSVTQRVAVRQPESEVIKELTYEDVSAEISENARRIKESLEEKVARVGKKIEPSQREKSRLSRLVESYREENEKLAIARRALTSALTEVRKNGEPEEEFPVPAFIKTKMVESGETIRPAIRTNDNKPSVDRLQIVDDQGRIIASFNRSEKKNTVVKSTRTSTNELSGKDLINIHSDKGAFGLSIRVTKR